MDYLKIMAIGIIATSLLVYIRQYRGDLAVAISLGTGVIVFLLIRQELAAVVYQLSELAVRAGLNSLYLIGFAAQACRDANEKVLGEQIEFAGKVLVLFIAVPVMLAVLDSILELLP